VSLFYQHTINANTALGIWAIEENEPFFSSIVPLERDIVHPHKRLQHLAGRYLLKHLFPDFPYNLIRIADTRKPFLSNDAYHFSISHCGDFAAAIVSKTKRVGIDIELVKPKVDMIKHKFLAENELIFLEESRMVFAGAAPPELTGLTLCWSAKESVYKWYGFGNVDFKKHIQLIHPLSPGREGDIEQFYNFCKEEPVPLTINSKLFNGLVLSYVVT
jgi:phosphopantetheinyl transferase